MVFKDLFILWGKGQREKEKNPQTPAERVPNTQLHLTTLTEILTRVETKS